jgi:hypothetical protein
VRSVTEGAKIDARRSPPAGGDGENTLALAVQINRGRRNLRRGGSWPTLSGVEPLGCGSGGEAEATVNSISLSIPISLPMLSAAI